MRKFWLALLLVGCLANFASAAAPKYDLLLLEPCSGGSTSDANGVTEVKGTQGGALFIVGNSYSPYRPTLWMSLDNFVPYNLGSLGGGSGDAKGVNSIGYVVGTSENSEGQVRAFGWVPVIPGLQDLGDLGGVRSDAYSVNASGVAAGDSFTAEGALHACRFPYGSNVPEDLSEGHYSQAFGINNENEVVGREKSARTGNKDHAVMWGASGWVDLDPAGSTSTAWGINNGAGASSWVVGEHIYNVPGLGPRTRGFMWNKYENKMHPIPSLGGDSSRALAANSKGQVVGYAQTSWGANRAFLYTKDGGIVDLNTLATIPLNVVLTCARGISEQGAIVGTAQTYGGYRAFLLRPKVTTLPAIINLLLGN